MLMHRALLPNAERKEESNMVAGVAAIPIKIGAEILKQGTKKAVKKAAKKSLKERAKKGGKSLAKQTAIEEAAMKQAEAVQKAFDKADRQYPMPGLKAGGIVDRNYLKGR